MDSIPDIVLEGEAPDDRFGFSIAGIGDVNHDGEVEILVGAPGYDDHRGRVYMYAGSHAGVGEENGTALPPFTWHVGPNPAKDGFTISYNIGQPGPVRIDLFDVTGRLIKRIADRWALPGAYVSEIDLAHDLKMVPAPGIYFVRIRAAERAQTAKLAILK